MCVIVAKPKGQEITEEMIKKFWKKNPDGGGFAYAQNGKIIVYKTLNEKEYISKYKQIKNKNNKNILLHFRIKTKGNITIDNIHPFKVEDRFVYAHNGTITEMPDHEDKSDTVLFGEIILSNLSNDLIFNNKIIKDLIENYIGQSKVVIMDTKGDFFFYNKDKGKEDSGIWYSNLLWKYQQSTSSYYGGTYYGQSSTKTRPWLNPVTDEIRFLSMYTYKSYLTDEVGMDITTLANNKNTLLMNGTNIKCKCGTILQASSEKVYGECNECTNKELELSIAIGAINGNGSS